MPILLLGLVFVIGLFIYYLATTKVDNPDNQTDTDDTEIEDVQKEENVIFLPQDIEGMKEKYKHKK